MKYLPGEFVTASNSILTLSPIIDTCALSIHKSFDLNSSFRLADLATNTVSINGKLDLECLEIAKALI